jgi:hypothetical protein
MRWFAAARRTEKPQVVPRAGSCAGLDPRLTTKSKHGTKAANRAFAGIDLIS